MNSNHLLKKSKVSMGKILAIITFEQEGGTIPDGELLLVDGIPMVFYVARACVNAGIFDDIYIASDKREVGYMAEMLDVKFFEISMAGKYGNMPNFVSNEERHEVIISQFLSNHSCDYLVNVHGFAPLVTAETIRDFTEMLSRSRYEMLVCGEKSRNVPSVLGERLGGNYGEHGISGSRQFRLINAALWGCKTGECVGSCHFGDDRGKGRVGSYPIPKRETLLVQDDEDLFIVEACLNHLKRKDNVGKHRFHDGIIDIDDNLERLIKADGSPLPKVYEIGDFKKKLNLRGVQDEMGTGSWSYPVVLNDNDQVCFIQQKPGEGCRKHYHTTKSEFWIVFQGEFEWRLDGGETIHAKKGDIVCLPKGTAHIIVCVSKKPGVRLACGARDMEHIYV